MSKAEKTFEAILRAESDNNIRFDDLAHLLSKLGFEERVKGSHHLYTKLGVTSLINIQQLGSHAKGYQVKQVRDIIQKHSLRLD